MRQGRRRGAEDHERAAGGPGRRSGQPADWDAKNAAVIGFDAAVQNPPQKPTSRPPPPLAAAAGPRGTSRSAT